MSAGEPEYGVRYNRTWSVVAIAHPATDEHGDCSRCLALTQDAIHQAHERQPAAATAMVEQDEHWVSVVETIMHGLPYLTPAERDDREEERRQVEDLVKAGASTRDLRERAQAAEAGELTSWTAAAFYAARSGGGVARSTTTLPPERAQHKRRHSE